MDVDGVPCILCFNCRHVKPVEAFTDRTRSTYQHADKSHHCLWCLYRAQCVASTKAARLADDHDKDQWKVWLTLEEVKRSLPQAPEGATVMVTGSWLPGFDREVVTDTSRCRVEGCGDTCLHGKKQKSHNSRLCLKHRHSELWEVSPHRRRNVRWCPKCGWQPVGAWAAGEKGKAMCTVGRRKDAERKASKGAPADIILADGDRAPSGHEWLCWHSGREDKGMPRPCRRARGRKRKGASEPEPVAELGPERWCLVRGCTWRGAVGKSEVCPVHRAAVLCSEREAGQPPLWMYCAACQKWMPALGYTDDDRCSARCNKQGKLGLKGAPKSVAAAKPAAEALARAGDVTSEELRGICAKLGIGRILDPAQRELNECAYVSSGCDSACGKRFCDGHKGHLCAKHRSMVAQRADGVLEWGCPRCQERKPVAGMRGDVCQDCYRVWGPRWEFLAALREQRPEGQRAESVHMGPSLAAGASAVAGASTATADGGGPSPALVQSVLPFARDVGPSSRRTPGGALPGHSASAAAALLGRAGGSDDGAAGMVHERAPTSSLGPGPLGSLLLASLGTPAEASDTDVCDALPQALDSGLGLCDAGTDEDAAVDEDSEWLSTPADDAAADGGALVRDDAVEHPAGDVARCRGERCRKILHPERSLDGWCVVCLATKKIGVSVLALFVLAAIPGCLHMAAGAVPYTLAQAGKLPHHDVVHGVLGSACCPCFTIRKRFALLCLDVPGHKRCACR